jgi:hypothetical protein
MTRPDPREAALSRLRDLGSGWVGFDDSHHYGDAVLKAIGPDVLNALDAAEPATEMCGALDDYGPGCGACGHEDRQQTCPCPQMPRRTAGQR